MGRRGRIGNDDIERMRRERRHQLFGVVLPADDARRLPSDRGRSKQSVDDELLDRIGNADVQLQRSARRPAAKRLHQLAAHAEDLIGVAEHRPADVGEHQRTALPLQQALPEALLEQANQCADRGSATDAAAPQPSRRRPRGLMTGIKLMWAPGQKIEPERNPFIRLLRRLLPLSPDLHGGRFFISHGGRWHGTRLLVALCVLEMSDIVFAVDSVPAIFAVTRGPLIVFMSNILAVLGLRAMYFLLADAFGRFELLKYALAYILIFVGLKMTWLNTLFDGKFPVEWSLSIIAALLIAAIAASLIKSVRQTREPRRLPVGHPPRLDHDHLRRRHG